MKKFKKTIGYCFFPIMFIMTLLFGVCFCIQDWCDSNPENFKDNYKKE